MLEIAGGIVLAVVLLFLAPFILPFLIIGVVAVLVLGGIGILWLLSPNLIKMLLAGGVICAIWGIGWNEWQSWTQPKAAHPQHKGPEPEHLTPEAAAAIARYEAAERAKHTSSRGLP